MNFKRRVGRLEKEMHVAMKIDHCRVVVTAIQGVEDPDDGTEACFSGVEKPLGLLSCDRDFHNGLLLEIVSINGGRDSITNDEIDRFVESFPISGLPPDQKLRFKQARHPTHTTRRLR